MSNTTDAIPPLSAPPCSGLEFSGCDKHPDRLDLSCAKFRRNGEPVPMSEVWSIIQAMRETLRERCFHTAGRKEFDRQGYSMTVDEETAIRDINYRDAVLHATADEAIDAALREYCPNAKLCADAQERVVSDSEGAV